MIGKRNLSATAIGKSSEAELLLLCAVSHMESERADRVRALLRGNVDWAYLLRMAGRHRVMPLLYWNLNTICPDGVPKNTLDELRDHFYANGQRSLILTGELLKILNLLEEREVSAIPYKGPVLATVAYGNLALREFGDLDLLVRKDDALKARKVLTSLGYSPPHRMAQAQEAAFLKYDRQFSLMRDDGCVVELHWTVAPRAIYFVLDPEYLWKRVERVALGGGTVASFSPEDLFLILCVHGSAHQWERVGWICDIAELIRVSKNLDWERLVKRAKALKCRRMLLLGLLLANTLLDAELPESILGEARADSEVQVLAAEVNRRLFSENLGAHELFEGSARWWFHFRMMERLRDRLRYVIHRATTPTLSDWEIVEMPRVLFPCYPLLRPIRLGRKFGRRLAEFLHRMARRSQGSSVRG
jgi:hypothetical protein